MCTGECDEERAAIAFIAWLLSGGVDGLKTSAFVPSVLTIGDAVLNELDLRALGFSGREDIRSMLDDEPVLSVLVKSIADLAPFRE